MAVTREQVVQWAKGSGVAIYSQVEDETMGVLIAFATLARADLEAELESPRKDAERYLWLKSQKGLDLSSCGGSWIKGNIKFNASHRLCANGTAYAPYETLDEAIDAAIAAPKQEK